MRIDKKLYRSGKNLMVSVNTFMPLVYFAVDKFRNGVEIDFCSDCGILSTIVFHSVDKKYCYGCAKSLIFDAEPGKTKKNKTPPIVKFKGKGLVGIKCNNCGDFDNWTIFENDGRFIARCVCGHAKKLGG